MYTVIPVQNNKTPCEGPKVCEVSVRLTDRTPFAVDLFSQINSQQMSLVQSFFIDNADNADRLVIVCDITGQRIIAPPFSQGYIPCLVPNPPRFSVAVENTPAQPVTVKVFACNFAVLPAFWISKP